MLPKSIAIILIFFLCFIQSEAQKKKHASDANKLNSEFIYYFHEANKNRLLENYDKAIENYLSAIKINSQSAASFFYLASINIAKKEYQSAFKYASNAVSLQPNNIWYKIELADIYYMTGKIKESINLLNQIYSVHPNNDLVFERLYKQYHEQNDILSIIKLLEDKLRRKELSDSKIKELYSLYMQEKFFTKGEELIVDIIKDNPEEPLYRAMLTDHFFLTGNKEKGEEEMYKMLRLFPEDINVLSSFAAFCSHTGKNDEHFQTVKKLLKTDMEFNKKVNLLFKGQYPTFKGDKYKELLDILYSHHREEIVANTLFAEYYIEQNQKEEAIQFIKNAIEADQNNFNLILVLFELLYDTKQFEILANEAQYFKQLFPIHAKVYLYQGIALYETGNYNESVEILKNGINFIYDDVKLKNRFFYYLAENYHGVSDHQNSDLMFENIIQSGDNFYLAYSKYAYYLAERNFKIQQALQLSELSVAYDNQNPIYTNSYAFCLYKSGDYQKALIYSGKAIEKESKNFRFLELHGDILFLNGNQDEALKFWILSKENGNNSTGLTNKIEQFKTLKAEDIK